MRTQTVLVTLIAALAIAGAAHAETPARKAVTSSLERNRTAVRRLYLDGINQRRWQLLPELIADDYVGPKGVRGPSGFASSVQAIARGVPDIQFAVDELIAEGDLVVVRWTWSGTHTGTLFTFPPSGRPVTITGIAIYRLRDGKIVQSWLENDRIGVLQQIGVLPADLSTLRAPAPAR